MNQFIHRLRVWFKSPSQHPGVLKGILIGVVGTLIVIGIFHAGMFIGFHKALFMMHGQGRGGFGGKNGGRVMQITLPAGMPEMHGAIGTIKAISLPTFTLTERDNTDREVLIGTTTKIRRNREQVNAQNLRVRDNVIIFGQPDDQARIEARLIRIMDDRAVNETAH
jgi:hypothetical protein